MALGVKVEPDLGSFSFHVYDSSDPTLVGKEIAVKGDLKEGEWAKLALKGGEIQEKGSWLWNEQRRLLFFYLTGGLSDVFSSERYSLDFRGEGGGYVFVIFIVFVLLWFVVGFLAVQDAIAFRVLSGVFVSAQTNCMMPIMIQKWIPFEGLSNLILVWIWMPVYLSAVILVPLLLIVNLVMIIKNRKKHEK